VIERKTQQLTFVLSEVPKQQLQLLLNTKYRCNSILSRENTLKFLFADRDRAAFSYDEAGYDILH